MQKIIICPNEYKMNILSSPHFEREFHNIKFMTMSEFINNYFYSYDDRALLYLMNKYNYNLDVCSVYISNMYFIDLSKDYKNSKLAFLKELKKELIDNNLLIINNIFREYIKDKVIEVKGYYDLDLYLEKALNYTVSIPIVDFNSDIYEFNTIEEEVNFVCIKIRELLDSGIDINKIFLCNVSDEYNYILSKLFNYYNIPINIDFKDSIFGMSVVQDYLKTGVLDLDDPYKNIINKKIINILSDLSLLDDNDPNYRKILINKFKNTYLSNSKLDNAINIKSLNECEFMDDQYVFVLGFNLDSLPQTYKDISYISDNDKKEVDLYDTVYLNKRSKDVLKYLLSRIKNLTISYKLSSPFQKYYPSNLISDLGLNVIKNNITSYNYSNKYNMLKLGEGLDKYYLYGEVNNDLEKLYNSYNIKYNTYSNKYTGIDNNLYLENIPYPLKLSYTSINSYNECRFKYYINYVLKLGDYTDTFASFIGSMYHYILTLYKKSNFDLDLEFSKYLEKRDLSLKEKLLLVKVRRDLEELIDVLRKQQLITGYDSELYEKEIKIPIDKKVSVEFVGYIDKIMYYKNIDDTYFSIIDYKTGSIDTNISLMRYGLHMQLPVYLYLISYSKVFESPIFTGIYYQNILFNYPTWSKSLDKDLKSRYLLKGYSSDNVDIISRFDSTYEDSSYIKSMKYNPEKGFGTYTKLISDDLYIDLVKYTKDIISKNTDDIINSDFSINPKIYDSKNISCKFCKFRDLCFVSSDDFEYLDKVFDLSFLGGEE